MSFSDETNDVWDYSPYRATLRRNGEFFALVTHDGKNALPIHQVEVLLRALNDGPSQVQIEDLIAESHRRQLGGEDYQKVATEIGERVGLNLDRTNDADLYAELESSPSPGCDCQTCENTNWESP